MRQYKQLLHHIKVNGRPFMDRTGTGCLGVFGSMVQFNVEDSIPILTAKYVNIKNIIHELLWFLSGDTNIKYLVENNVHIWTDWPLKKYNNDSGCAILNRKEFEDAIMTVAGFSEKWGDIGPCYGKQWRNWKGKINSATPIFTNRSKDNLHGIIDIEYEYHDQIKNIIDAINNNPTDRGIILSGWNVADLNGMALRPCHTMYQFKAYPDTKQLSMIQYCRSQDLFLGTPYNWVSGTLLLKMIAQVTGYTPYEFIWDGCDVHLYNNHMEQVEKYLDLPTFKLPNIAIDQYVINIDYFKFEHFDIEKFEQNYKHGPFIPAPVAV